MACKKKPTAQDDKQGCSENNCPVCRYFKPLDGIVVDEQGDNRIIQLIDAHKMPSGELITHAQAYMLVIHRDFIDRVDELEQSSDTVYFEHTFETTGKISVAFKGFRIGHGVEKRFENSGTHALITSAHTELYLLENGKLLETITVRPKNLDGSVSTVPPSSDFYTYDNAFEYIIGNENEDDEGYISVITTLAAQEDIHYILQIGGLNE